MSSKGLGSSTAKVRLLSVALIGLGVVALVQQQILLRRPPVCGPSQFNPFVQELQHWTCDSVGR